MAMHLNRSVSILVIVIHQLVVCCESDKVKSRNARPTDDGTDVPGFLDSIERDVLAGEETEVEIGNTTVSIPKNSAGADYRIRVSRRAFAPELTEAESLVLGDAQSDVVDVELFDPATTKTLASSDLLTTYELKQKFKISSAVSSLGLMVISDKGTSNEQRVLIPNSELSVSYGSALRLVGESEITVRLKLKLTTATLWFVSYADDALKNLQSAKAIEVFSVGGATTNAVVTIPSSSISGASVRINSDAPFTNSEAVSLNLSATGATEMIVTNSAGCVSGGSWEVFSATKSWTLGTLNSVTRVYAKFRAADGSSSQCISDSITHDDIPPAPPTAVLDGTTSSSLTASPTISWTASSSADLSHYEVAIGTSGGGTNVKTWTTVGKVKSFSIGSLSLSDNTTYYASIRAVDYAGLKSSVAEGDGWSVVSSSLSCPTGYIKIPGNSELDTSEFCVMKYEAKNVGGIPTSQMTQAPWVNIARGANSTTAGGAWKLCKDLGVGYDLISNPQWQTIARNIEGVAANWSSGANTGNIDDGNSINRGHSDNSPNSALAASTDDNPCAGTLNSNCTTASHEDFRQKRTHSLSNGAIIWDFAGNVAETNQTINPSSQGQNTYMSTLADSFAEGLQPEVQAKWGAAGDYSQKSNGEFAGFGYGHLNYAGGAIVRGGDWFGNTLAGVFAVFLNVNSASSSNNIGFRCVFMN